MRHWKMQLIFFGGTVENLGKRDSKYTSIYSEKKCGLARNNFNKSIINQ